MALGFWGFSFGRKNFAYLNDDFSPTMDPKCADWRVEDAQIRSYLWNSMESKKSCSQVFFPTTKLVREQAQELNSGVNSKHY